MTILSSMTDQNSQQHFQIETDRLIIRPWKEADFPAFAAMNNDPLVMEHFPSILSEAESRQLFETINQRITQNGYGFWACELTATQEAIGFVGLNEPSDQFYFSPCIEIGWRLRSQYWRQGYAKEAASAVLHFAFETLKLDQVVAFTAITNIPSQGLMQALGMTKLPENFLHPRLPKDHTLAEHVVYVATPNE